MLFPVASENLSKCRFTSKFGSRTHPITKKPDMHRGIDIAMPSGTPLLALDDGVVTISKVNNGGSKIGFGYYLAIQYNNGLYSLYAHLRELPKVKAGQKVKKGDVVAFSGNTGSSTGPHLHFEIHKRGLLFKSQATNKDTAVDPVLYYPQLHNMLGKYLTGVKFNYKEDDELVELKEKWQETLLIDTLEKFKEKKALNNADYWLDKVKNKTLTTSELGLLALVMAERD